MSFNIVAMKCLYYYTDGLFTKKLLFPVQKKIVEIGFLVLFLDLAPAAKKGEYN